MILISNGLVYPDNIASLKPTLTLATINGEVIPFQSGIPLPTFEKQNREIIELNGKWKKLRYESADHNLSLTERTKKVIKDISNKPITGITELGFNDANWDIKILPNVENDMHNGDTIQHPENYNGAVWYRRKFYVPSNGGTGKFYKLMFGGANYVCDVWVNGKYVGYHEGGYTPFAFEIGKYLNIDGDNLIAIRIDNPAWGRDDIVPYSSGTDWFNYTGLIRDIYVEITNGVSIIRTDIVPLDISGNLRSTIVGFNNFTKNSFVKISAEIYFAGVLPKNNSIYRNEKASELIKGLNPIITQIISNDESISPKSAFCFILNSNIPNPSLWDPRNPNLYVMKIIIQDANNKIIDEYCIEFGIRIISASGSKVLLNGKPVFLNGVARHEDHPLYGRSLPKNQIIDDLELIKDTLRCNLLRTAAYPNDLYTYLIADRLGITIMEDIPIFWFEDIQWDIQNNKRHVHEQMFKEMVFRDFNRPSIIMWSLQNEGFAIKPRSYFINLVKNELRENYDDKRLIGQSAAGHQSYCYNDSSQNICDFAGWTMWIPNLPNGCKITSYDEFLSNAHNEFPDKPILITEFGTIGTDFIPRWDALTKITSFSDQNIFNCDGYVMGCIYWVAFDFWSTSPVWGGNPYGHIESSALFDSYRKRKPDVNELIRRYTPFFDVGGAYNGPIPCK